MLKIRVTPWHVLFGLLLITATVVASVPAQAGSLANLQFGGNVVAWEPQVRYDQAELRVSGPAGVVSYTFAAHEVPFLDLATLDGPVDGSYTFELHFTPLLQPEVREMLLAARDQGDNLERQLRDQGYLPSEPLVQTGYLVVQGGQFVVPGGEEEPQTALQPRAADNGLSSTSAESETLRNMSAADQVILDDLIVDGSACVGTDCANGESFGFDTLRLKENNLRIKFDDTSNSASFPFVDWQLTANESANGGANKFSIDDITNGRTPFTIEASAPSHSLYVDDGGRIGAGTSTPVVEVHVVDGDTPTLRLEQDGSSGFASQTWDLAGNETNLFFRDVSNGSQLPFKIRPGADTGSLVITDDGDILMRPGSTSTTADAALHMVRTDGTAKILVEENQALTSARTLMQLTSAGPPRLFFSNSTDDVGWELRTTTANSLRISDTTGDGSSDNNLEFELNAAGDLTISGSLTTAGGTIPDYVFEEDYSLMTLDELSQFIEERKHLPNIPSASDVADKGGRINMSDLQLRLLEKVEELTLYTLEQHTTIQELQARLATLEAAKADAASH